MIRTLAAKLAFYKSFHKFLALQVAGVFLLVYVATRFASLEVQGLDVAALFARPAAWRTGVAATRWLFYVPAFFVIQLVSAEFELKLVRAHVIAGLERYEVLLGWLLLALALSLVGVAASIAAIFACSRGSGVDGLAEAALGLGVYGASFLAFAVLAAVALQKPVPALLSLMLWPLVVEPLAGYVLNKYGYGSVRDHMPFAALGQIVAWPGMDAPAGLPWGALAEALGFGAAASVLAGIRLQYLDL